MSRAEVDRMREMLAARQPPADMAARREAFETMMTAAALPDDVATEPVRLSASLHGLWVATPAASAERAVLYLHGGAFVLGSSRSYTEFASRIAAASGARVLVLDYALAPERPFPAALEDTMAALGWLHAQGFAPGQLAIAGDSAGGNLAAAAVQAFATPPVAGAWLISPYLDLTHSGGSIRTRASRDPFIDPATMPGTRALYCGEAAPTDPRISPLFGPVAQFPPTLIQVGSDEVLFDDAARFAACLRDAGRDVVFQEWVDMIHVWPLFGPMIEEGRWASSQGGAFLARSFD